jgi:hypothetical protein
MADSLETDGSDWSADMGFVRLGSEVDNSCMRTCSATFVPEAAHTSFSSVDHVGKLR